MTIDVKKYTGNLRILSIDYDLLSQVFTADDEYTQAEFESDKVYVGKVGGYKSFENHGYWNCVTIEVEFSNGHTLTVNVNDVEAVDDDITDSAYLPKIAVPDNIPYTALTADEKEFADKLFLQIASNLTIVDAIDANLRPLLKSAVDVALSRTLLYGRFFARRPYDSDAFKD